MDKQILIYWTLRSFFSRERMKLSLWNMLANGIVNCQSIVQNFNKVHSYHANGLFSFLHLAFQWNIPNRCHILLLLSIKGMNYGFFWSKINVRQLFFFYYIKQDTNGTQGTPCTVCVGHVFTVLLNYFLIMFPLNDKRFMDFLTLSSNWTINVRAPQIVEFRIIRKNTKWKSLFTQNWGAILLESKSDVNFT